MGFNKGQAETKAPAIQFFTILKLLIKNLLRPNKQAADEKKGTKTAIFIIIAVAYLFIAAFIVVMVALLGEAVVMLGLINEMIALLFAISSLIVLFFGLVSLFNTLYFSKDSEFFLALPVKPSNVFFAKFCLVYATELIVAAAVLVPSLITLGIVAHMDPLYYIVTIIGIFLAPALPLILATILAVPLMYVVGFFKNKSALTSVLMLVLFAGFFGVYFYFVMQMQNNQVQGDPALIVEGMRSALKTVSNIVYPFLALARCATLYEMGELGAGVSSLINALIFLGATGALLGLSLFISRYVYNRGAASQLENVKQKSTGKEKFIAGSALKALVKKEWRELIRTPAFAYQCLAGILLSPIMVAVFSFSMFGDMFTEIGTDGLDFAKIGAGIQWFVCFGFLLMFGVGLNVAASTAVTREGKGFFFSKMMPVDYKTQIRAKQIVCNAISLAAAFLSLIVLTVATKEFLFLILGFIYTIVFAYGFNNFSIYFDLKKPKLDWATPNEAVKQNFRIMVPYFINIAVSFIFIAAPVICFIFLDYAIACLIIWAVFFAFAIIMAIVFHKLLNKNVDRFYEELTI